VARLRADPRVGRERCGQEGERDFIAKAGDPLHSDRGGHADRV